MATIALNEKFAPLWESDCFTYIITGGRGSGKSFAVGDFIENLSFEKGHKILFTRYTLDSASDTIIPEFEEKIELEGHPRHFHLTKKDVFNISSGTEIMFRGIKTAAGNQTAKLKSIEGLTTWVLDEAEELTDEQTFNKIKQSIRKKGIQNRIILVLNPQSKAHWIYKRFFERPGIPPGFNGEHEGVCYIHTRYLENIENLSAEFLAEAEKSKRFTPNLYRYEYLGEWVLSTEDAIFKDIRYYETPPTDGPVVCYIDTADEGDDHFAALFVRLTDKNAYVIDAIFNQQNLNINEEICKERFAKHNVDRVYVESNSFGAYFIRNLREQNPHTPVYADRAKTNKMGRILAQSGWILEHMFFSQQEINAETSKFIAQLVDIAPDDNDNDDAPDCASGLAARLRRDFYL